MSKRPIPDVPAGTPLSRAVQALKENLQEIMGHRGGKPLAPLADTATTAEIIARINEIQDRLQ